MIAIATRASIREILGDSDEFIPELDSSLRDVFRFSRTGTQSAHIFDKKSGSSQSEEQSDSQGI